MFSSLAGSIISAAAPAIVGGILGGGGARQQNAATNQMNAANNQAYTDSRPYLLRVMQDGEAALDDVLAQGNYTGPTYAGLNPASQQGVDNSIAAGRTGYADAGNFMNLGRGFGANAVDLYNRAGQSQLDAANAYAADPANYSALLDAATFDDRRNLNENTLTNLNQGASMSGNANSSRAGVASAVAERGYQDRRANTAVNIQDALRQRFMADQQNTLSNLTSANNNLSQLYGTGFTQGNLSANNMTQAGGVLQRDQQNQYDDQRNRFEEARDFETDQLNKFNQGILNGASRTPAGYQAARADPVMGAVGGAMSGLGLGNEIGQAMMGQAVVGNPFSNAYQALTNPTFGSVSQMNPYYGAVGFARGGR